MQNKRHQIRLSQILFVFTANTLYEAFRTRICADWRGSVSVRPCIGTDFLRLRMKELLFEITDCNPAALGCGNEATRAEPDRFAGLFGSRCFVRPAPAGRLQSRSIIYTARPLAAIKNTKNPQISLILVFLPHICVACIKELNGLFFKMNLCRKRPAKVTPCGKAAGLRTESRSLLICGNLRNLWIEKSPVFARIWRISTVQRTPRTAENAAQPLAATKRIIGRGSRRHQ